MTLAELLAPVQTAENAVQNTSMEELMAAVDLWKQGQNQRRLQSDLYGNIGRRRSELVDLGQMGDQLVPAPSIENAMVRARLPQAQVAQLPLESVPVSTRELPGIGRIINLSGNSRAVTGRYGTGVATPRKEGEKGVIIDEGKKFSAPDWFRDASNRQGESNIFFDRKGRKIV